MKSAASLAAATSLLVAATRLGAQTLSFPRLPPEAEAAPLPKARPWEYALGAGAGWDNNLDFLIPNGPSAMAVVPRGGLARVFWEPHGWWRASAAGGLVGHPELGELHRYKADVGLEVDRRPSPNTRWLATATYGLGYSDSTRILLEQGVLLPLVAKTRSLAAELGLAQRMGARRSLRINGRYYRTVFDSPRAIDGESLRGTFGLEHELSQRSTAAIEYSLEYVRSDQVGRTYITHFGSFQWMSLLSPTSGLLLEAGASYTPDATRAGLEQKENFFGGASFSRQVRRSHLKLFARREVTPAFGIGVSRMEVRAGLGASIPIGRDWELRALASRVQPETRQAGEHAYPTSDDVFGSMTRRLGRHFELSLEARYRRRGATSVLPLVEAFQASVFLTLLSPSWKSIAPAAAR